MGVGDGEKVEDRQKVQVKVLQKRRFHQHQKNCTTGGRDSQNLEEQRIQVVQEEVQVVGDEEERVGEKMEERQKVKRRFHQEVQVVGEEEEGVGDKMEERQKVKRRFLQHQKKFTTEGGNG